MFKKVTLGLVLVAFVTIFVSVIQVRRRAIDKYLETPQKLDTCTVQANDSIAVKNNQQYIGSDGVLYDVVVIDTCEYIENSLVGITHKGNCKNPYHRNQE